MNEEKLPVVSERELRDQLPPTATHRAGAWIFQRAKKHPVVTLAIAGALLYVLVIFGPAFAMGISHAFTNRAIEKTKAEASAEKKAADQEKISAGQIEIERKAEDLNREQALKPKRQQTAATLAEASQRRKVAEELYEKNRNDRRRPDPDDLNLHRRNCSDLAELYPGQRFAGCQ